jgi:hypothetical protein
VSPTRGASRTAFAALVDVRAWFSSSSLGGQPGRRLPAAPGICEVHGRHYYEMLRGKVSPTDGPPEYAAAKLLFHIPPSLGIAVEERANFHFPSQRARSGERTDMSRWSKARRRIGASNGPAGCRLPFQVINHIAPIRTPRPRIPSPILRRQARPQAGENAPTTVKAPDRQR